MAVGVHAALGEQPPEAFGATFGGQPFQLAAQGLDLGGAVQPQHTAQRGRRVFLERFWPLDAQEREQEQRHHAGAQTVECRPDRAPHCARRIEHAGCQQRR